MFVGYFVLMSGLLFQICWFGVLVVWFCCYFGLLVVSSCCFFSCWVYFGGCYCDVCFVVGLVNRFYLLVGWCFVWLVCYLMVVV